MLKLFQKLGAFTVSADDLAREVVAPGTSGLAAVVKEFGTSVLASDGTLDRKKLAKLIFNDPTKRQILESVTHPLISALATERFQAAIAKGFPLSIYESPLLFEAGLDKDPFRKIVVVTAREEVCVERIMARDSIPRDDALTRIRSQFPIAEKVKRANIIIDNSSDLFTLEKRVAEVYRELTSNLTLQID